MNRFLRCWLAPLLLLAANAAFASFHTFQIEEIYSNADGTVQFVVLQEAFNENGQEFLGGLPFTASQSGTTRTFTFPNNLPSASTAGRRVLIATQGFAALGLVTPDYTIPDHFIPTTNGTVNYAGVDQVSYATLPTDGANALYRSGQASGNLATNFAGRSGTVSAAAPVPTQNFTALWWNPSESGWGLNVNHQGDTIFATLFTYDAAGKAMWLFMSNGAKQADGFTYSGNLFMAAGPAFNASPFTPITAANLTQVGTMSISFPSTAPATLSYAVNGVPVTKSIQKQVYGSRAANCVSSTGSRSSLTNYQDLWWIPSESGWGINVTHQDNILFATLFTYGLDGKNLWLVMSSGAKQPDGSYLGDLFQATGPAFNAQPFTPITAANLTKVGTMQLRFSDGEHGTLTYSVNGANVTKQIVRQEFGSTEPSCS